LVAGRFATFARPFLEPPAVEVKNEDKVWPI